MNQELIQHNKRHLQHDKSAAAPIHYRMVTQVDELLQVVELQKTAWPMSMLTPLAQLVAASLHGGSIIGAFEDEKLIGFCYGFAGYSRGEPFLASHMMAIHPDYRDRGIGMRLKLEQRLWAIDYGYRRIVWTFDPFETRNGYLNLCKLGGVVQQYIPAIYGIDAQSLPTDRFFVEWHVTLGRVQSALAGQRDNEREMLWETYPSILRCGIHNFQVVSVQPENLGASPGYLLPVPANIRQMKQENLSLVAEWQNCLRNSCTAIFSQGYRVVALIRREGLHHDYVLEVAQ